MFSTDEGKFALLAFSSLFSVINPIEAAPIFVTLTAGRTGERRRMAFKACLAATLILTVFAAAGGAIFAFFGITLPAFQIAGGILFTIIGMKTLQEDFGVEVIHVTAQSDGSMRFGARFLNIPERDAGTIRRFIAKVERDRRMRT